MPTNHTDVLNNTAAILDCFSIDRPDLGVREVSRMTGLTTSTTGRLMQSMRDSGILTQNPVTRTYMLGSRLLSWAGVYSANLDIRTAALPVMDELHRITRETISLYILEGSDRVCVERMESPQTVRITARLGRRLPLYAGSAGKAILAFLPEERREEYLNSAVFTPFTSHTYTDPDILREELIQVQKKGYAYSQGEWLAEAAGVAAPILGAGASVLGAVSISGPLQRFTPEAVESFAESILRLAGEISSRMGYRIVTK